MSSISPLAHLVVYGINVKNRNGRELAEQIFEAFDRKGSKGKEMLNIAIARELVHQQDLTSILLHGYHGITHWSDESKIIEIQWMLYDCDEEIPDEEMSDIVEEHFGEALRKLY